jgi:hypothetical protein
MSEKKVTLSVQRSKYQGSDGEYTYTVVKATNTLEWTVGEPIEKTEVSRIIRDLDDVTVHVIPPKV